MKRKKFIAYLNKYKCVLTREGANHTIILNLTNKKKSTLPRHSEIQSGTMISICKKLDIPIPFEK